MPTGVGTGSLTSIHGSAEDFATAHPMDPPWDTGVCAASLTPVFVGAICAFKIPAVGAAILTSISGSGSGLFPVPMTGSYNGSLVVSTILDRMRSLSGQTVGQAIDAGDLYRKRGMTAFYHGILILRASLLSNTGTPEVFHVSMTKSEILLTATIGGEQVLSAETYLWTLKTVKGSGLEKLLTPTGHNTRFVNLTPFGYYVIECDINNGEGILRSATFTVLVDSP